LKNSLIVIPMLSWDPVAVGALAWTDNREPVPCEVPRGVELKVEPAIKSQPFFKADKPWESGGLAWTNVTRHEGLYRMWYGITGEIEYLCYAQSLDGFNWKKPDMGIIEFDGSKANNICYVGNGASHSSVFYDSSAAASESWKCAFFSAWWEGEPGEILSSDEGHHRLQVINEAKEEDAKPPLNLKGMLMGMVSPDGLHWTKLPEPILEEWHDTHNIVTYDESEGKYVGYFRGFYAGRRATSYSETTDFTHWPASRLIHGPQHNDPPDTSIYSNCYCKYPGNKNIHLMFPAMYHQSDDTVDTELAVSLDGTTWVRHIGQPVIELGMPGTDDEAFIYADPQLLRCDDGQFRLIYHAGNQFHNEWYNEALRTHHYESYYAWAEWQEDRLAGIYAKDDGEMTILLPKCGSAILANYRTEEDGWIKFEMIDRVTWPPTPVAGAAGYQFEDMAPMTGDETRQLVKWGELSDLGKFKGTDAAVRVRMHKATLFALAVIDGEMSENVSEMRFPV